MQDFLFNCYYDSLTIEDSKKLYSSTHKGKVIPQKSIDTAKAKIKSLTNKEWN